MEKLTGTIIRAIQDKKGKNIVSLDLSKIDGAICSCFIVCNADSTTQVAAIAAGIEEQVLETLGEKVWRVEGQQKCAVESLWTTWMWWCIFFRQNCVNFTNWRSCGSDAPATRYEYDE